MSKTKFNLIIISHPDDETIFFSGLIQQFRKFPWHIICVTNGNADRMKNIRLQQFKKACALLKVKKVTQLMLPDIYSQRLDLNLIKENLAKLAIPENVFTHGPLGEYGHPHHQDVSYAVNEFYHKKCPVFCIAHNCKSDITIDLTSKEFNLKSKILSEIYFSETERFINFVPSASTECFSKIQLRESKEIYNVMAKNKKLNPNNLKKYLWMKKYFKSLKIRIKNRPF